MTNRNRRTYDAIGLLVSWVVIILVVLFLGAQVIRWVVS